MKTITGRKARLFLWPLLLLLFSLWAANPAAARSKATPAEIQSFLDGYIGRRATLKGTQCVALFNEYLQYFWGISCDNYPVGSAWQIFNYNAPSGWQKISKPGSYQVGDIVVWAVNSSMDYGHVAIVYSVNGSSVTISEQGKSYPYRTHNLHTTSAIRGVFRPPLDTHTHSWDTTTVAKAPTATADGTWTRKCSACGATENVTIPKLTDSGLRDGQYRIYSKLDSNKLVSVTPYECKEGGNIALYSKGVADQVFILKKQSNGSYVMKYSSFLLGTNAPASNLYTNALLNAADASSSRNQWHIVPAGDSWYHLVSRTNWYNLDVGNSQTADGSNIGTWLNNGANAQLFRLEFIPCTTHSWDGGKVTKAATETAEGVKTYTCTVCGETKTESIPKVHVHLYEKDPSSKPATCTEDAVTILKCACGDTKTLKGEGVVISDWRETMPSVSSDSRLETKTQYASRTLSWKQSGSGTIDYAESWPAGFNKSHALYSQYNKTPKTASETASEKVTVSTSHLGYIYWHWCMGANLEQLYNRTIESTANGKHQTFHAFYSTQDAAVTTSANARRLDNYNVCHDTWWWLVERVNINRCSYTTYTKAGGAWSAWQDGAITPGAMKEVKTRKLYRVVTTISGKATGHSWGAWTKKDANTHQRVCAHNAAHVETQAHTWDAGAVTRQPTTATEGVRTYTCTVCKAARTESIAKLPPETTKAPESTEPAKVPETSAPARAKDDISPEKPASESKVKQDIVGKKSDADRKGSTFSLLLARGGAISSSSVKLLWRKVSGAQTYVIYGTKCGKNNVFKWIATAKGTSYTQKKLKKNTYYKYIIVARKGSKVLATSKIIHVATAGGKNGNYKSIKLNKKQITLSVGGKRTVNAKVTKGVKKVNVHRKVLWESTNLGVATVNANGRITGVSKGRCWVYAYLQNGLYARVQVIVK